MSVQVEMGRDGVFVASSKGSVHLDLRGPGQRLRLTEYRPNAVECSSKFEVDRPVSGPERRRIMDAMVRIPAGRYR